MASCDPRNWFPGAVCAGSFAAVFLAWCLTEVLYARLGRDRRRTVCDRGSYLVGMISVHSGVAAGVTLRALGWGAVSMIVQCAGVLVMALGIALRFWAIRRLGRHFSVRVAIQPEHRLVTDGPYRWLRHPCYTGTLLTVMGVPTALGIWLLAPVVGVLFVAGHSYRIHVEEQALVKIFGGEYHAYCRRTWRIVPGW